MVVELAGRVVVLTGASRGIGALIARDLGAKGAHLVLAARDRAGLDAVAAQVREAGGQATVVCCDLCSEADRERLIETARAVGPIEVLVNNAGIEIPVAVVDHTPGEVERTVAVNLLAPIDLTRRVLPEMVAQGRGAVVMISSMSGKSPTPYNAVYTATKHGLNGFTASVRIEVEGTGVNLGVVCPSFVAEAGMWSDTGVKAPALLREVAPEKVVRGVHKVLGGASEVLVTPGPIRPLLALGQLFPWIDAPFLRWLGVLEVLKQRARVTAERKA